MAAIPFADKEKEFRDWRRDNPDGFVLNTTRTPSEKYLILHGARCWTISGEPNRGQYWTKNFIKICATDQRDIHEWVHQQKLGTQARPCRFCLDAGIATRKPQR